MLLTYEYESLLVNEANRREVVDILTRMDRDVFAGDPEEHQTPFLDRLRELGEYKIVGRITQ